MEKWPWMKQLDLWPRPISPEELEEANDELRRAGNYGERKGEDLVSEEETTKALEDEGANPNPPRTLSRKENVKRAEDLAEKLERDANREERRGKDKKKE